MNKIVLSLWLGGCLAWGARAQHSVPSATASAISAVESQQTASNWLGYERLDLAPRPRFVATEQEAYVAMAGQLLGRRHTDIEAVQALVARYPGSVDAARGRLLVALWHLQEGDLERAHRVLSAQKLGGLWRTEREQAELVLGYMALQSVGGTPADAHKYLAASARGESLWSDYAALYLASLTWHKGDARGALAELQARSWHHELLPEVEYQGVMIGCETDTPSNAVAQIQSLQRRYPQVGNRPRLIGALGKAYYALKDYGSAVRTLASLGREALLPHEAYALGASLYQRRDYARAVEPLQIAARSAGKVAVLAQFALGNIYRHEGDATKAQLALGAAASADDAPASVREQALYQLIELGFTSGSDAFGQNVRRAEDFLEKYPNSVHRGRIVELLRGYLSGSSDYAGSIALIDRLSRGGTNMSAVKQEVLLRWAASMGAGNEAYLPTLDKVIALGTIGDPYAIARAMRAAEYLKQGKSRLAEADARAASQHRWSAGEYEVGAAHYLLGYALFNQKKYREAEAPLRAFAGGAATKRMRADALVRLGDIQQVLGRASDALRLYEEAHKLSPESSDEALYRLSGIYGLRGQYEQQMKTIEQLEKTYPHSAYLPQLLYDKGRAQVLSRAQQGEAAATFALVEERYPSSEFAPRAALERALLHSNNEREGEAISAYKSLISRYPDSPEAATALADLKSLYAERDALDEYAQYASTLGGKLRPSQSDEAHLAYLAIESRAKRGTQVAEELRRYLSKYPNAADRTKAQQLLAQQYRTAGNTTEAIELLETLASEATSIAEEFPLRVQLGELYTQEKRNDQAAEAYARAYAIAGGSTAQRQSVGLAYIRLLSQTGRYTKGIEVADQLLGHTNLTQEARNELALLKGKAQAGNKSFNAALATLAPLTDQVNSLHGAEGIIERSGILYRLGRVEEAIQGLNAFVSSGSAQRYWIARAFISLADYHAHKGEHYLSKQYIESLRDNYDGNEEDIQQMIQNRLNR